MKITLQDERRYILRFDKGEEVMAGILDFAKQQQIYAASFNGIGATNTIELGFFNEFLKDYRHKQFLHEFEIISLIGNIGAKDGQPVVHAHGSFGNSDFEVVGGHVFRIDVSITCEIFLIKLDGQLNREQNKDLNLNLLA